MSHWKIGVGLIVFLLLGAGMLMGDSPNDEQERDAAAGRQEEDGDDRREEDDREGCEGCTSAQDCRQRGRAAYAAVQSNGVVYVFASGVHPTAGFRKCLSPGPERIFPPFADFKITPPEGIAAQVITPFTVCMQFEADQPVSQMTVRDADGNHAVSVKPL